MSRKLHHSVREGDHEAVRAFFDSNGNAEINAYDRHGYTPLMVAVKSPEPDVDLVRLLLDHGADVHQGSRKPAYSAESVMALAVTGGDPQKVNLLLQNGADIHYVREGGYDALIDAVHGRDVLHDRRLIDLLKLLISCHVHLDTVTSYNESACRVLSRIGRFDAVRLLLDAGADPEHLKWTPLMRAVALNSLAEVREELSHAPSLEDKDSWERTAWLLAIQTGEIGKAALLRERGADIRARGRCGKPPLFYAIETFQIPMLRWLLEIGTPVDDQDDFGSTPLIEAVEASNSEAVNALLEAGADVNAEYNRQAALEFAQTAGIATRLLEAGANPLQLSDAGRRALLGLQPEPDEYLLDVTPSEFREGRVRRFGVSNPEMIQSRYCEGMIRAGITASEAADLFKDLVEPAQSPVWCAKRFGQSLTFLPDGRAIQIAGEHEDSYDRDFCIYNDVFVHEPDGMIRIFAYPETLFPPTDFHSAMLLGRYIYIIGSLGYIGQRRYGETSVFRLDTGTYQIEEIKSTGEGPGWINSHLATAISDHEIRISGGMVATWTGDAASYTPNTQSFIFDAERRIWTNENNRPIA